MSYKRIYLAIISLIAFSSIITGCSKEKNKDLSIYNQSYEQTTTTNSSNKVNEKVNWQSLSASFNPPKIDNLLLAIKDSETTPNGSVVITPGIKRQFNKMGQDYLFFLMPSVSWYDFKSANYDSTGNALAYVLRTWTGRLGDSPNKTLKFEVEARLRKIFAAPDNKYPPLIHQEYFKSVKFDGETYSLWPESYNDNTMVYDLIELNIRKDSGYTYFTASVNEYGFDLTDSGYEQGDNEAFLFEKAKKLGVDNKTALAKLLETGELAENKNFRNYIIEFRVEKESSVPQFVSIIEKY